MNLKIFETAKELGDFAGNLTADHINAAIKEKGEARLLVSTGMSQFETLEALRKADIDWSKVTMFHLDEYIGLDETHNASFVKYLKERFTSFLPEMTAQYIDGTKDPAAVIEYLTKEIKKAPIDIALIGIGVNAHVAFNDPPADFETKESYHVVTLDKVCKEQQVGEGWFPTLADVPVTALSMTVHEVLQSKVIISAVPHAVKAEAVYNVVNQEVNNMVPSTILKTHPDWTLCLDKNSASKIKN